ncbi:conserved hypothetical protein [Alkaliphilus metalliredigens QYMF]|uniref:Uncharacterized protein n=1 Tax=Alkaliphilus metalliredigens (strain QYMF) TaxID=293826 RepID=A6TKJ5_ALKMQ|nr:MotA/TolQ/ExbB proton channel family protein [Alkaliphilus metalliredigens]ABR46713.1 conserved hypothetical protein [Alkaliphilus metalliredigens QYMF]
MTNLIRTLNPLAMLMILMIVTILVSAIIMTFMVKKKYEKISEDLHNSSEDERNIYEYAVLNSIIEDYKTAATRNPNEVNTQAIIEKNFNRVHRGLSLGERFVRQAVSLMIILGLLGTFYGLTLSIADLVALLGGSGSSEMLNSMDSIVQGLINSVSGMSVAFITSLFGIASSIILTIIIVFVNIEDSKEAIMVEIEEYLDNKVALDFARQQALDPAAPRSNLEIGMGQVMEGFTNSLNEKLSVLLETSAEQLIAATKESQTSAEAIQSSMESFNHSIETFSENTRDFSEFNHNLRTNIERMDVAFADLVQDLKENGKDLSKNQEAVESLSRAIDKLSERL